MDNFVFADNQRVKQAMSNIASAALGVPTLPVPVQGTILLDNQYILASMNAVAANVLSLASTASNAGNFSKITLTAAQIKNSFSIPIIIIPAQGLGTGIQIISASGNFKFGTVPFTSSNMYLQVNGLFVSPQAVLNGELGSTQNDLFLFNLQGGANAMIDNTPMIITADADSLVGDSTIDLFISWKKITL